MLHLHQKLPGGSLTGVDHAFRVIHRGEGHSQGLTPVINLFPLLFFHPDLDFLVNLVGVPSPGHLFPADFLPTPLRVVHELHQAIPLVLLDGHEIDIAIRGFHRAPDYHPPEIAPHHPLLIGKTHDVDPPE